jgi:transposase-like protein
MATVGDILILISSLSPMEQNQLKTVLLDDKPKVSRLEQLITEKRFTGGLVCPLCGCIDHISRNGHRKDGKQRYICKDCGKTFVTNIFDHIGG